jgi:hypothetical protein
MHVAMPKPAEKIQIMLYTNWSAGEKQLLSYVKNTAVFS